MTSPLSPMSPFLATALLAGLLLAGCSAVPDRTAELPAAPAAFRAQGTAGARVPEAPPRGEWWRVFHDPVLDDLERKASDGNWTIRLAAARLAQARAIARFAAASKSPLVGLGLNATRQEGPLTNAAGNSGPLYITGVNLSYEVDLFGRLAQEGAAAEMDAAERAALLNAARLLVQADLAQAYFSLRGLDAERDMLRAAVTSQRETARLTQGLVKSGLAPELSVVRLQAETEALANEALALDRRRAELESAIALLVGEPASGFQIAPASLAAAPPEIPAGIPGTVLARRPDVGAAGQAMFAAQHRAGAAQDAWLPRLTLTGSGGFASPALGTLLAANAGSVVAGALLSLPLFDGGRQEATVDKASADLDAALAAYAQQILVAIKDVEDQLVALRILADQDLVLQGATAAARRTSGLVASSYRGGLASQLELLDAQRNELRSRRQALQVQAARYTATVGLVRALGGGWDLPG